MSEPTRAALVPHEGQGNLRAPTWREQHLVDLATENLSRPKPLTSKQVVRHAGYSAQESNTPQVFLNDNPVVKLALQPVVDRLKGIRDLAITAVEQKQLETVSYQELINGIDKLTKNIQLLTGGDTEKTKVTFSWLDPYGTDETDNPIQATVVGAETSPVSPALESLRITPPSGENGGDLKSFNS